MDTTRHLTGMTCETPGVYRVTCDRCAEPQEERYEKGEPFGPCPGCHDIASWTLTPARG